jgi:aryl-alcohol dehydrogenase-like predicted oxidoreductase
MEYTYTDKNLCSKDDDNHVFIETKNSITIVLILNKLENDISANQFILNINSDLIQGLEAVSVLKDHFRDINLALLAIKWILMYDAVGGVIPGASSPSQVQNNLLAADLQQISEKDMFFVKSIYEQYIKGDVHQVW